MKTVSPDAPQPRLLLFGIRCLFTQIVSARLEELGHQPIATLLVGPPSAERPLTITPPGSQLPVANLSSPIGPRNIPTFLVGRLASPDTKALVRDLAPEVIVVACFPRLIPRHLHEIATLGAVNIHPSLLPAHRGPDPLFWIMRDGGAGCGVTVHRLADRFDSGDILAQQPVPYPDGEREHTLEARLARTGADLALSVVDALVAGNQSSQAQDERGASYESWPSNDDYAIETSQSATHAWNFIRGVADRGVPIRIDTGSGITHVTDAVRFGASGDPPAADVGQVAIRFNPGWLLATLAR